MPRDEQTTTPPIIPPDLTTEDGRARQLGYTDADDFLHRASTDFGTWVAGHYQHIFINRPDTRPLTNDLLTDAITRFLRDFHKATWPHEKVLELFRRGVLIWQDLEHDDRRYLHQSFRPVADLLMDMEELMK